MINLTLLDGEQMLS